MQVPDDVILPERLWVELVQWRSGYRCEKCGRDRDELKRDGFSGYLTGHHLNHDHSDNRLENAECLCPSCHQKIHASEPRKRKCESGCGCNRHKRAWNKLDRPRCGHNDWYRSEKSGRLVCRVCRSNWHKQYYRKTKSQFGKDDS